MINNNVAIKNSVAMTCCVFLLAGVSWAQPAKTGPVGAESVSEASLSTSDLIGVWDVSLYFAPDQPPSATVMEISAVEDGAVTGAFYGSEFSSARATMHNGVVIFSAVTADGTGPYAHGMRMHAPDFIYGQTLSTGRDFVMAWEAKRREEPAGKDE